MPKYNLCYTSFYTLRSRLLLETKDLSDGKCSEVGILMSYMYVYVYVCTLRFLVVALYCMLLHGQVVALCCTHLLGKCRATEGNAVQ